MKITKTPQEFVDESLLLLRARPSTTKVSATYHAAESGKGKLTVKAFDPVSGAVIKFRTSKIAVVGRMVAGLNRLARQQANAPEPVVIDAPMAGQLPSASATPNTSTPVPGQATPSAVDASSKNKNKKRKGKP